MTDRASRVPLTVTELLHHRAGERSDRIGYRFLDYGASADPRVSELSYGQLLRYAAGSAAALREVGRPGDRVLIMCAPGLPYIAHFFGCLYAGMVAVPAYPLGSVRNYERLEAIVADCGATAVLVDDEDAVAKLAEGRVALGGAHIVRVDGLPADDAGELFVPERATPDSLALLQYTSGSTALPKGVAISHGNLLANARAGAASFGFDPDSSSVNWLPPYHDMGLVGGLIMPLHGAFPATHLTPAAFIRSPLRWLEAISTYRARMSAAPNFAYSLCVQRISEAARQSLDLSSWTHALNGAEPVRADVIEAFTRAFAPQGFRPESFVPCYGLAENTLLVTAKPGGRPPVVRRVSAADLEQGRVLPPADDDVRMLVSSGRPAPGVTVRIVDPATGRRTAGDQVGEICVAGESVAGGYFQNDEATERAFRQLPGASVRRYLRTGDLGTLIGGELFVTGRIDDLMIIRGRNVYPQDVEAASSGSDPVLGGMRSAAFTVTADGEDALVVVQELPRRRFTAERRQQIAAAVRTRIAEEFRLAVHAVVLAPPGGVSTTSSGKVRRKDCRTKYLAGDFPDPEPVGDVESDQGPAKDESAPEAAPPVASGQPAGADDVAPITVDGIEHLIKSLVAGRVGCQATAVSATSPFASFGLDSVQAVEMAEDLSRRLGCEVPATLVWDHPDIRSAAVRLAGRRVEGERERMTRDAVHTWAEPIAIVGVGCRFPGGADSPEAFWDLLVNSGDSITPVPAERWDADALFDPNPDALARTYSRHGGFIEQVSAFDHTLFGITAREAAAMDPQHRILLETAWHALEHAAIAPDSLRGSNTGVYIGIRNVDYEQLAAASGSALDAYSAAGLSANFGANRISYVLGLQGPSLVVDTACSGSLVAVHLACQALRTRECDAALAGGVNLMLSPGPMIALAKGRMLSQSGRCHPFDVAADGYVRGEGAGVVVLKRLSDALADRDPVLAVIRGSAVNQDGRSNGLTAPSGAAQRDVISRALASSGLKAEDVDYIEAHGTGTPLGDPIEIGAITSAFAPRDRPLFLGSVKANIGHLEAAAGIAGLIKATLALQHRTIPPHPHLSARNPHIPWTEHLEVPSTPVPWTASEPAAGVSSFGFGGTNAHLILQRHTPEPVPVQTADRTSEPPHTITLSAATPTALKHIAADLNQHLARHPTGLPQLAHATNHTRAALPYRATFTATDPAHLNEALTALADGRVHPGLETGHHPAHSTPHITYLAPGHGTPLRGTLAGLYGADAAVTETVDRLAAVLGPIGQPPISFLIDPKCRHDRGRQHFQPALYTLTMALAAWWEEHGIQPDTVLGYSAGAYAAAAIAGVFSLEDGARLTQRRGRLIAALPDSGGMATVYCEPDRLERTAHVKRGEVFITGYNGPQETSVAGPIATLEDFRSLMEAQGVRTVSLRVPMAHHCPDVEPMLDPLREAFANTALHPARVPFISDTTGRLVEPEEVVQPDFWVRHTRRPVRFDAALGTALERGATILLELGPGGLLSMASALAPADRRPAFIRSLSAGSATAVHLTEALGQVWVGGGDAIWRTSPGPEAVRLPGYPFERHIHWMDGIDGGHAQAVLSMKGRSADSSGGRSDTHHGALVPQGPAEPTGGRLRPDQVVTQLREDLAAALGLAGPDRLDPDAGLFDLGLTSVMAVELRLRMERSLGRSLPATMIFDHPTLRRLSEYVVGQRPVGTIAVRELAAGPSAAPAEPIAVVGIGCRLPGGADSPEAFWQLLDEARDATGQVPPDRWDADAFYAQDPFAAGKAYTRRGGFLQESVAGFDAAAFGISPREARTMDPQQRLLLECTWEALENAGCPPEAIEGSNAAVYLGISTADYQRLLADTPEAGTDPHLATGNTFSVAAGRLSHVLGVTGPSMAVDTACSSSLVAAHLAVKALRSGETDLALVGGVNLMLAPATTVSLAKLRALSPDGRCKAFSDMADGYGRGEGCGVIVLKRLSDAVAADDRIWALIRGTAVNQDGRSAGLTVPNGRSQTAVIQAALRDAGLGPETVGLVEAHGTGTPLGDPIEVAALVEALRPSESVSHGSASSDPRAAAPLWVGSAKSNVGHLEAAAGVTGIIKAALSLHHRRIPAHLMFGEPNRLVDWDRLPVRLPRSTVAWEQDGPRVAGISSFGFSGTNAHAVLEEAPSVEHSARIADSGSDAAPKVLTLSAHTPEALDATIASHAALLAAPESADHWQDITRTAGLHRGHLRHRVSVVADSAAGAAERLTAAPGPKGVRVRRGVAGWDEGYRLIGVYSGQGSQWAGMGSGLLAEPAAAEILKRCADVVSELAGWSLIEAVTAPTDRSRVHDTAVAQPAIFAVQAALTELWRERGVLPDAVVGHSVGEIAAAYAAGIHDLETACALAVHRGIAMAPTRGTGAMAAIGLGPIEVQDLIAPLGEAVTIAAVNSPMSTVVAGDRDAVMALESPVRDRGAFWAVVQDDYAFHTPRMQDAARDFERRVGYLDPQPPTREIHSTVTGDPDATKRMDADYWMHNLTQPVLFDSALRSASGVGHNVVLEIGPHPVLTAPARQCLEGFGTGFTALGSMAKRQKARETMLDAAGALYVMGYPLNHRALHTGAGRRFPLPRYPWQRDRHWITPPSAADGSVLDDSSVRATAGENSGPPRADGPDTRLLVRLREAPSAGARSRILEKAVQAEVAAVLGLPAGSRMDPDLGFFNAGMDSLISVELRDRLQARLDVAVPATAAFEHPTIAALTEFLLEVLTVDAADDIRAETGSGTPGTDESTEGSFADLEEELRHLSGDELTLLLMDELNKGERT